MDTQTRVGRIESFLVHGPDYYAAKLDNGGVRIGLTGAAYFDLSPQHALFAEAMAVATVEQAEAMHDELSSVTAPVPARRTLRNARRRAELRYAPERVALVKVPEMGSGAQVFDAIRLNSAMEAAAELLRDVDTGAAIHGRAPGEGGYYSGATGALQATLGHLLEAVQTRIAAEAALVEAAAPVARSLLERVTDDNAMTPQGVMVRRLNSAMRPFGGVQ